MLKKRCKKISIIAIMILVISLFMPISLFASQQVFGSNIQTTADDRIFGSDRYETAAKIAQAGWPGTSDYAVLAAGMDANLVDALTAAPLAKLRNAPILLTQGGQLSSQAEAELARLKVKTVYITSGAKVIKPEVTSKLAGMGISVIAIGGNDRFETSLNIAKEIGAVQPFQEVMISTAFSNADALSAASIAAAKGIPILLTEPESLPGSLKSYLDGMKEKIRSSYIIGGSKAVGTAVQSSLPHPVRAGGANRYETNLEILKLFAADIKPGKIYIANGENSHLVDALAGASLAALTGSPVVLAGSSLPPGTGEYVKQNLLSKETIALGGEQVVPDAIIADLTNWESYTEANWIKGSIDAGQPEIIEKSLKITGDKSTLRNAKVNYSIYIQGNNCTLDNVVVSGTIFIDPGQTGEATLKNVKAAKIVVMSGGQNSIHLVNSQAGTLVVVGDSGTRVEATGTTVIENTVVTSYAILDANGGVLGTVTVKSEPGKVPAVELRGIFNDPVIIDSAAKLNLGSNTTLGKLQVNADAEVSVPAGSSIGSATALQGVSANYNGGGMVNGSVAAGALPPAGGIPGGSTATVDVTGLRVTSLTDAEIAQASGTMVDISSSTVKIKNIYVAANQACTLKITTPLPTGVNNVKTLAANIESRFDIDELLSGWTEGNDGVSLASLKNLFPSSQYVDITGEIYQNGQLKKSVTLKLKIR